jgi:hypothetical protein
MPIEKHITLVSLIQIVLSSIGILLGLFLFLLLSSLGIFVGEEEATIILPIIGTIVGGFLIITSAAGLIGGIGLYKHKSWSRILLFIVSILDLFSIPIGTAVGIYTIWLLMQDETIQLLN